MKKTNWMGQFCCYNWPPDWPLNWFSFIELKKRTFERKFISTNNRYNNKIWWSPWKESWSHVDQQVNGSHLLFPTLQSQWWNHVRVIEVHAYLEIHFPAIATSIERKGIIILKINIDYDMHSYLATSNIKTELIKKYIFVMYRETRLPSRNQCQIDRQRSTHLSTATRFNLYGHF